MVSHTKSKLCNAQAERNVPNVGAKATAAGPAALFHELAQWPRRSRRSLASSAPDPGCASRRATAEAGGSTRRGPPWARRRGVPWGRRTSALVAGLRMSSASPAIRSLAAAAKRRGKCSRTTSWSGPNVVWSRRPSWCETVGTRVQVRGARTARPALAPAALDIPEAYAARPVSEAPWGDGLVRGRELPMTDQGLTRARPRGARWLPSRRAAARRPGAVSCAARPRHGGRPRPQSGQER